VWDCLKNVAFTDDQKIKIRVAGTFDLESGNINLIDFSGLQTDLLLDLLEAFDNEKHIIYVETGKFNPSMYQFNLEHHGNQ
jgi:hypothetical protein